MDELNSIIFFLNEDHENILASYLSKQYIDQNALTLRFTGFDDTGRYILIISKSIAPANRMKLMLIDPHTQSVKNYTKDGIVKKERVRIQVG